MVVGFRYARMSLAPLNHIAPTRESSEYLGFALMGGRNVLCRRPLGEIMPGQLINEELRKAFILYVAHYVNIWFVGSGAKRAVMFRVLGKLINANIL